MKIRMMTSTWAAVLGAAALALGVQVQAQDAGAGNASPEGGFHRDGPGNGGRMMQERRRQGRAMMMERRRGAGPSPAQIDTNNDGMIDINEFLAPRAAGPEPMLDRRDENGDGLLSREEIQPRERPNRPGLDREAVLACVQEAHPDFGSGPGIDGRFDTLDSNDDSFLDADELAAGRLAQAEEQFARLDADADGQLTQDELRARRTDRRELGRDMRECARGAAQSGTP